MNKRHFFQYIHMIAKLQEQNKQAIQQSIQELIV